MVRSLLIAALVLPTLTLASPDISIVEEADRLKDSDVVFNGTIESVGGIDEGTTRRIFAVIKVAKVEGAKAKDFKPGLYTFEGSC